MADFLSAEEIRRRQQAAKAKGWDDATIQRFTLIDTAQRQQRFQKQKPQLEVTPTAEKKSTGAFRANSLLGFGTSLLPFGEVLRKKLAGEKITGGDVALETALTALPLVGKAVGKGVKAVKGLTAAERAAQAVGKGAKVAEDVNKEKNLLKLLIKGEPTEGAISGRLTRGGESLKAQARGVVPGVKPQGAAEKLLPSQADEINRTLNAVERKQTILGRTKTGAKGSVNKQLRTVETAQQKALSEMDNILAKKNLAVSKNDTTEIIKNMRAERKDILGLKKEHIKEAQDLEKRITKTKDVQGLEKLRRSADERINFARNPNSPDPALEKVYMSLRRNIDKKSTSLVPELKQAKTNYGKLESAKDTLIQSSPATMRQFAGQGPTSRLLGGSTAQATADIAGRTLTRAGKITAAPLTQQAGVRLPFSTASAIGAGQPEQLPEDVSQIFQQPQNTDEEAINQLVQAGITDPQEMFDALSGQGDYAQADTGGLEKEVGGFQSQYGLDQYLQDINADLAATGGKNVDKLNKIFTTVQAAEKEQRKAMGGGKLNAEQQKSLNKIGSAENIVGQMEELLGEIGLSETGLGAKQRGISTKVGAFFGEPGSKTFYDSVGALSTKLSRALGEVGTMTDKDREVAIKLVPGPGDTKASADRKLKLLYTFFQDEKDKISELSGPSGSQELPDDITQLFQEQYGF